MQRKLRALAHGADEEADADDRQHRPIHARDDLGRHADRARRVGEDRRVVERAEDREDRGHAEEEAEIADAVHEEGLQVRVDRGRPREPEADEEVGNQTHRFPAEEELQEVVRHHQHHHREGEERDVGEESLVAGVVGHVADGVDVHHERHEGHHRHHGHGEAVDEEAHLQPESLAGDPGVDLGVEARAVHDLPERPEGGEEGDRDRKDRRPVREGRQMKALLGEEPVRLAHDGVDLGSLHGEVLP